MTPTNSLRHGQIICVTLATLLCVQASLAQAPAAAPAAAPTGTAPAKALPSAKEIFAHAIAAAGGADLLRQQTSRLQVGTIEMPAQKLSGTIVTRTVSPDYMLVETEIPGFGKIMQGVNKSIGWSIDPMRGPALMTDAELAPVARDASIESELDPALGYDTVEVVGEVAFRGTPSYKLKFTKASGGTTKYYSVESGHLIGSEDSVETGFGRMDVSTVFKDFKTFSGRTLASVKENSTMGQLQRVTITSIDFAPIAPGTFDLPKEIKALVDARSAKPATPSPSPTPASGAAVPPAKAPPTK